VVVAAAAAAAAAAADAVAVPRYRKEDAENYEQF
jgi:hypothetical protein